MPLAVDGQDGNGLEREKLRLNFSIVSTRLQKVDIDGHGLFFLCKFRLYLPLDVQRQCYEWIKFGYH